MYDTKVLKQVNNNAKHDTRYKVLLFGAISRICKLKVNRKKVKTTESTYDKLTIKQNGVNHTNLKLTPFQANDGKILARHVQVGTVNACSLKNKDQIVFQELIRNNLDILIITENWLNDSDEGRAWSQLTELNQEPYKLFTSNRKTGKGGGFAMVCKKNFEVTTLASGGKQNI